MSVSDRREREQQMRREVILDSARRLFTEKGFDQTTVDAIASYAELGKGTIYSYFSSKEEIYIAMLDRELNILKENMRKAVANSKTAIEALNNLYTTFIRHHKDHHLTETLFIQTDDQRFIRLGGLLTNLRERASEWVQLVGGVIKWGIEQGELVSCNVEKVSQVMIGIILGVTIQQSMGQLAEDLDGYRQTVFLLALDGIRKRD
jgi:AcrR family transcriptional regulator